MTTDGFSGAAILGLGFRILSGPIIDAGSGGLAFGFDAGANVTFADGAGAGLVGYTLGLPLVFTATWVQSVGRSQLLARAGVYSSLNYSVVTGSNGGWSLDLGILGIAGVGVVLPSSGAPKWILAVDLLFGGGTTGLITAGLAL